MPVSTTKPTTYTPPRLLSEAKELLRVFRCGHTKKVPYHVRDRYSIANRATRRPVRTSFVEGHWEPARWSRQRVHGEPDIPRYVEEPRYLTAEMVAQHIEGKGYIGVTPPSWVGWFAFDIDLPKKDKQGAPLPYEDACLRRDMVLEGVWNAFDFGTGREPIVLRTPGGGYHIYVPLTAKPGQRHNWDARVVRRRVIQRLRDAGMQIKDGHLEVWPCGKVLRLPMGAHMAMLKAQNPDDASCLGLVPVHATETERSTTSVPGFRRSIRSGAQAFLEAFEASRLPLGEWLLEDEANWSEQFGPHGDDPPSQLDKNQSLTSSVNSVSQQFEEGENTSGDFLLRGGAFRERIERLLEKGLTESGTRHDAILKLTYYFGICLGLSESRSLAELQTWLESKFHVTNENNPKNFVNQSLREARHYYRNHVARIGSMPGVQTVSLGLPLSEKDHDVFEGQFSTGAVEEAALIILRFVKSHSNSGGSVEKPVQITTSLMKRLCGEKRVSVGVVDGKKRRVRATQLAIEELTTMGIFTLYSNYKVRHYGRHFCCWYKFGSGQLPEFGDTGELILASCSVSEGTLLVVASGTKLGRAKVTITPSETVEQIPDWVQRMYGELNIAPLDLTADVSENLGAFRDFQGAKRRKDTPAEVKEEEREFGTVIAFEDDRGYGFIVSDKGGRELFFHQTAICDSGRSWRTLEVGQRVEFTRSDGAKGPKALWITPLEVSSKPSPARPVNSNTRAEIDSDAISELPDWIEYFAEGPAAGKPNRWKDWRT